MKTQIAHLCAFCLAASTANMLAGEPTLESAPPVVVRTTPAAGAADVDPALNELAVTFSKPMQNGSWSWSTWGENTFPDMAGAPRYLEDGRTCVLPVKLEPGKFYATWLNSDKFKNFKDAGGRPAVPYLLTFTTTGESARPAAQPTPVSEPGQKPSDPGALDEKQRAIFEWTDRQFRSYFDSRSFEGWTEDERTGLETRLIDALKGPQTRDYYQAIGTLAALRSTNALPALRSIAFERRDKNNRDRWMATRALGIMGDSASVPDLIHLVYHGNINTRWWAQIALVQITGQNFGSDWTAWGGWWNATGRQPSFEPELIRWWEGQPEPDKLAESLASSDKEFIEKLRR